MVNRSTTLVRVPREVHTWLTDEAAKRGITVGEFLARLCARAGMKP